MCVCVCVCVCKPGPFVDAVHHACVVYTLCIHTCDRHTYAEREKSVCVSVCVREREREHTAEGDEVDDMCE